MAGKQVTPGAPLWFGHVFLGDHQRSEASR
ncbi:hypothetical protein SNOG_03363 [Parastagonospora nodorum SN15]|uniref:Uncharacterized protein n=1 Tax=Phaeosphaeria nodorum (strain SN15 / ATCC MYA-4574 / FGSC 10173) TaxID=321614 RepID=Q0UY01_PHANO|nr:hypothetical protein SNOG_03363 [Parastagonospora nodorum SN15]EAT88568.1 hypothetical protein SNOG_03363 [Parastagonospora nodorum SN15]